MAAPTTNPSGITDPIWYQRQTIPDFPPLRSSTKTDVCIVGAGIAGLTCAYLLLRAGRKVVVLDEKPIGGGETGRTSAHLASITDNRFTRIQRLHGRDAARLHYQSHAAAIDLIEDISRSERIGCDFARLDAYLIMGSKGKPADIRAELAAARQAGVAGAELLTRPPFRALTSGPCARFPDQGRFHPLKFLAGLARIIEKLGGRIHCGQRVTDLSGDGPVKATISSRLAVTADFGISATNIPTPINNWVAIYTKQSSYRTYMVGLAVDDGAIPDALYWDLEDPYHYARLATIGPRTFLIVGGEDHKAGQPPARPQIAFEHLEAWSRVHFPPAGRVVWTWSGQVNEPHDGLAYIGRVPTRKHKACFVITGDSGMGLTHGALGAVLLRDLITGAPNDWESLYSPKRGPLKTAGTFASENLNAAATLTSYLTPGQARDEIPRGEGALVRRGLRKLAVYRDESGRLHERSAVCPHLGCILRWNTIEKSWDCPCHGSRYTCTGRLINGPAITDLKEP